MARLPEGLARTLSYLIEQCSPPLSARCDGSALPELATGLANPLSRIRRPLYQVVSPTTGARKGPPSPDKKGHLS
jgi:hypothetical protein